MFCIQYQMTAGNKVIENYIVKYTDGEVKR